MIVADSSYLAKGILEDRSLLTAERIITADLALYETTNTILKHHVFLKRISDGAPYLSILHGLLRTNALFAVKPWEGLLGRAYELAVRNRVSLYDTIFVALALETGLELRSFDKEQLTIMKREKRD